MAIEGEIAVKLDWDGHRVHRVTVRSSRPFAASRVVEGRTSQVAATMMPRLFSICAQAQRAAAESALAVACGDPLRADAVAELERDVMLETVQEYLWRLLIDLPKAMGGDPVLEPVSHARRAIVAAIEQPPTSADERTALAQLLDRVVATHVFGMPAAAWVALDGGDALANALVHALTVPAAMLARLLRIFPPLAASDVPLMPAATAEALRAAIVPSLEADAGFARTPLWNGRVAETGTLARMYAHPCVAALARQHGKSVATRIAARTFELAALIVRLEDESTDATWVQALDLEGGAGLSAVQTARGLLLHRAEVVDGIVRDYRIVAPTEWNFHPAGPLARGLEGHVASDEAALSQDARLAVQALDPCVGVTLEVGHA